MFSDVFLNYSPYFWYFIRVGLLLGLTLGIIIFVIGYALFKLLSFLHNSI